MLARQYRGKNEELTLLIPISAGNYYSLPQQHIDINLTTHTLLTDKVRECLLRLRVLSFGIATPTNILELGLMAVLSLSQIPRTKPTTTVITEH